MKAVIAHVSERDLAERRRTANISGWSTRRSSIPARAGGKIVEDKLTPGRPTEI
jgi:hypothetical protein